MRRLGTLLTALLLATAAAAGAGDNIKWVRSENLPFVRGSEDLSPPEYNVNYYWELYTLKWPTPDIEGIKAIEATYEAWEIIRTKIFDALASGAIDENTLPGALENGRRFQEKYIAFSVIVSGRKKHVEEGNWEFKLVINETPPGRLRNTIGPLWSGEKPKTRPQTETDLSQNVAPQTHVKELYLITENRPTDNRPRSLKLIVETADVKRGFEWRFVEE